MSAKTNGGLKQCSPRNLNVCPIFFFFFALLCLALVGYRGLQPAIASQYCSGLNPILSVLRLNGYIIVGIHTYPLKTIW